MLNNLLQMNQLEKFYSLIARSRVRIKFTSQSDNHISFAVEGSHRSAVEAFYIIYTDDNGTLSRMKNYRDMITLGSYGWVQGKDGSYYTKTTNLSSFKQGSEGYKLLTDLFYNIKRFAFATYNGKEFCRETFLPFIKGMHNLDSQRTTEDASTIGSTTTELFNSSQFEESTTEEIKSVMEEIKRSNASNGITTKSIEYVQDMTRKNVTFSSSNVTSRNIPAFPELSSTNATLPQLPNESGIIGTTVAGLSTFNAYYIIAPVLLVAAVTVGGCWFLYKSKRKGSYDLEKSDVEDEVEAPSSKNQNSLLDEINIETRKCRSF